MKKQLTRKIEGEKEIRSYIYGIEFVYVIKMLVTVGNVIDEAEKNSVKLD